MKTLLSGIGKKERAQLSALLKAGHAVITPKDTAETLKIERTYAAQLLALWAKKGWLSRIKRGAYIPIPLQAESPEIMADEPWVIAKALFDPCYIGGWSAAEHWQLTEQIFNSTMVFSSQKSQYGELDYHGVRFNVKIIKRERIFGTKTIWRETQKVSISDPTRTIVDAFNDPAVVGGIRMAIDILGEYLRSEHKDLDLLIKYSVKMKNSAIFKRLGFVFEEEYPKEKEATQKLKSKIKKGYSQLDPSTPGQRLVTSWNLWIPTTWKRGPK